LWFVGSQSLTYDEPTHIRAGLEAWRQGRFDEWNDQPPLARALVTLPLLGATPWTVEPRERPWPGTFWTMRVRPDPVRMAWLTRSVNIALGVALAALLWTASRRFFNEGAANIALGMFAVSPPLIAHFSLATVDGAMTLMVFAAGLMLLAWRRRPSGLMTMGLGAVLGLLLLTKFSAIPIAGLVWAVMMVSRRAVPPTSVRLAKTLAAMIAAGLVVWSAYRFHVGPVTFRDGPLSGPYARTSTVVVPVSQPFKLVAWLPAPEMISALGGVLQHMARGQPAFLAGETSEQGGWHRYYAVVAALKWPPLVWVGAVCGVCLYAVRRITVPSEFGLLLLVPATLFAFATASRIDAGDRYILAVYPFLLLLCAGAWTAIKRPIAATVLGAAVVLAQAADSWRYAPDYLSYFTPFVKPSRAGEFLTDSNLDWGQGLIALSAYEREHPDEPTSLAYFGGVDPRDYGVRAVPLEEGAHPTGTVIVSATHLSGQYLHNPHAFRWLLDYPRVAILNHSLHVFKVPAADER
jgi:hypothetical protein